jgi:hypothetical protein
MEFWDEEERRRGLKIGQKCVTYFMGGPWICRHFTKSCQKILKKDGFATFFHRGWFKMTKNVILLY